MQLNPREYFTVVRGLPDHTDSTTYYVRAVIRNARTDVLITALDLVDQGDGHRFLKEWQVPADPSGLGFYISITTSVYTDSGYTTKAANYGDQYDTYLVADRSNPNVYHGGGGESIDYRKIRQILKEERPAPVDLEPITHSIKLLQEQISGIVLPDFPEIPKPDTVDLMPIINKFDKLPASFKEIIKAVAETNNNLIALLKLRASDIKETKSYLDELAAAFKGAVKQLTDDEQIRANELLQALGDLKDKPWQVTIGRDKQPTPVELAQQRRKQLGYFN